MTSKEKYNKFIFYVFKVMKFYSISICLLILMMACGGGSNSTSNDNPGIEYKNVPDDLTFLN